MTTDLSGGKPDGAVESGGVKTLQTYTEDSVMSAVSGGVRNSWGVAKGNFITDFIGGLFKGMNDILNGLNPANWLPAPAKQYAQTIRDGQVELNNRTDLLSPLLDYCSMSSPPGGGTHNVNNNRFPFTYQIGPCQNTTPMGDGRIRLDDKGLWDLRCMITAQGIGLLDNGEFQVFLRVIKPDGGLHSVYSEQGNYMNTLNHVTVTSITSVVIPAPGYFVDVYIMKASGARVFWSGPKWNRLTVQHISRNVENGTGAEESTTPPETPPADRQEG